MGSTPAPLSRGRAPPRAHPTATKIVSRTGSQAVAVPSAPAPHHCTCPRRAFSVSLAALSDHDSMARNQKPPRLLYFHAAPEERWDWLSRAGFLGCLSWRVFLCGSGGGEPAGRSGSGGLSQPARGAGAQDRPPRLDTNSSTQPNSSFRFYSSPSCFSHPHFSKTIQHGSLFALCPGPCQPPSLAHGKPLSWSVTRLASGGVGAGWCCDVVGGLSVVKRAIGEWRPHGKGERMDETRDRLDLMSLEGLVLAEQGAWG